VKDVALIDDHGIRDARAYRLLLGVVKYLDDAFGDLNGGGSLRPREGWRLVIVRSVPQSPQRV